MIFNDPTGLDINYYDKSGQIVETVKSEKDRVYYREVTEKRNPVNFKKMTTTSDYLLTDNKGDALTNQQFKDLLGTVYAEMTPGSDSWEEGAAIYSVMENRGNADDVSTYTVASNVSDYGVYGWNEKGKYNALGAPAEQKQAAFTGLIRGILDSKDYSNGGFYWHGIDLGQSRRPAYRDYYLVGLNFTSPEHNIWNLAPHKSGRTDYDYIYETTAAFNKTTFMRYTKEWINATRYRGNW